MWYSRLNDLLQHQFPKSVPVQALAAPCPTQLPGNTPKKTAEKSVWTSGLWIHGGDLDEAPGSWFWLGTTPADVIIFRVSQWINLSLYSPCVCEHIYLDINHIYITHISRTYIDIYVYIDRCFSNKLNKYFFEKGKSHKTNKIVLLPYIWPYIQPTFPMKVKTENHRG